MKKFARTSQRHSSFDKANLQAVEDCLRVRSSKSPGGGARAVVNIAAVHVPSLCERAANGIIPSYLNCYDLENEGMVVGSKQAVSAKRAWVDAHLAKLHGRAPSEIYFAAVELNGTGVHFYGDICLVLKASVIRDDTIVLDRNSYDLTNQPLSSQVNDHKAVGRENEGVKEILDEMSGRWVQDVAWMGAIKVVGSSPPRDRRMTTGQISDSILTDEDYMEVLKEGSFGTSDLEAARLSIVDISVEDYIERSYSTGQLAPDHIALLWVQQRRKAVAALRKAKVSVVAPRTTGRIKA